MADFTQKSDLRQFAISLPDAVLYVNAHWLAELSPYFYSVCFDSAFSECREGKVSIQDVSLDDITAMLEYLCPDKKLMIKKSINDSNISALMHCAFRFQIPVIQNDLEKFIENEMDQMEVKPETLLETIIEAQTVQLRPSLISILLKKLAYFGLEVIEEAAKELPKDMSAPIIEATRKYLPVLIQPSHSTTYGWAEFNRRMFF